MFEVLASLKNIVPQWIKNVDSLCLNNGYEHFVKVPHFNLFVVILVFWGVGASCGALCSSTILCT